MLTGENIVVFGKDWSDHPTSVNHVMSELAENNRVLWLNSIGSRAPDFSSGRDIKKIFRKLASFADGPTQVKDTMWTYTPIVLPFPHSKMAVRLNREILKQSLGVVRRKLGMEKFQLWSFYPTPVEYVGKLGEELSVYYIVDAWDQFDDMDKGGVKRMDREFAEKADVVFATANSLVDLKKGINPETHLASHGVDFKHFSQALDESTPIADDIKDLPGEKIIGFFGLIQTWVDQHTICELAKRHPEWSVVIIGNENCDTSPMKAVPNVHLLGGRPYTSLPTYCRGFDVGIIPFEVSELTHHVNPIKLREYLSAGLPVVSSNLPEVEYYNDICTVAKSTEEFIAGVEQQIAEDTPEKRKQRSESMRTEQWSDTVRKVGTEVARVKASMR